MFRKSNLAVTSHPDPEPPAISPVPMNKSIKVLTVPADGKTQSRFALPEEHRKMMCLLSDGRLFVSGSHKTNPHVLAFQDRLVRNNLKPRVFYADYNEIAKLYSQYGAATNGAGETSIKQNEVIRLIREGVENGASDVHFRIRESISEVWMRVDGELEKRHGVGRDEGLNLCATIYQSMCDVASPMFLPEKSQDARLKKDFLESMGLKGARVATRPTDVGLLVVLRLLYERKVKASLRQLGYLAEQEAMFKLMAQRTKGINVIAGPTGSGKSTTLETVLSSIIEAANGRINVITCEDPPEYTIPGAVQTYVQYASGASDEEISEAWAKSIANLMRLDPDIGMIGEMRDYASAVAAFRMAMTGHGVYTTLHANDAVSILGRLRDMGVDMSLLTDPQLLTGLVNQSLAPKPCPDCRRSYRLNRRIVPDDIAERIERFCNADDVWLKGPGCPTCNGRGTKGRTVIAEAIIPTKEFMHQFRANGALEARSYWVAKLGGITKNQHLIRRVNEGMVDPVLSESMVCALNEDEITLEQ